MKKTEITILLCFAIIILGVFLLSCEKNYITQAPEEHIPEYHMTYCYVRHTEAGPNYVITINTKTREVIDSVAYEDEPFRELRYFDQGNKAVIVGHDITYVIDVLTHDTLATINAENVVLGSNITISSDEQYLINRMNRYILTLPDLNIIDSTTGAYIAIGIDGGEKHLFAYEYYTNKVYAIDFSVTPTETLMVEVAHWLSGQIIIKSGFISPDNQRLYLNCQNEVDEPLFVEYKTDSLQYVNFIEGLLVEYPAWSRDGRNCYGTYDGNVVKFDLQSRIITKIINKENIYSSDYWLDEENFYAGYAELTSDDKLLYIQLPPRCGGPCIGIGGQTLVYDLLKNEIVHRFDYSDYLFNGCGLMRLNPKDWSI